MLRKYISDPDRSLNTIQSCHMQASSIVISSCLLDNFMFISTDRSIPKVIIHNARTNFGVNISYQKAWRTKGHTVKILKGDAVESYTLIPSFFGKLVKYKLNMINFLYQIYIHSQIDEDRQIS